MSTTTKSKYRMSRGRKGDRKPLQKGKSVKSRSASAILPGGIFRPDLLGYNPVERSGYHSLKIHLPLHEQEAGKLMIAQEWLKCLKSHEEFKPIYIHKEASLADLFEMLHKETERLFPKHNWMFRMVDDTDAEIIYFESLGDVNTYNLPLDWIYESKDILFRNTGLWLMKSVARAFGIEMLMNDTMDMTLAMISDNIETDIVDYLKEQIGDGPEDMMKIHEAAANYYSYGHGKPKELRDHLKGLNIDHPNEIQYFEESVEKILKTNKSLGEWLKSGYALLKSNPLPIVNFHLVPDDMDCENGRPVTIHEAFFFPYSFDGYVFEQYDGWINDTAQCVGTNDIYNFGRLTERAHEKPEDTTSLRKLMEFLRTGRDLHFKTSKHGN